MTKNELKQVQYLNSEINMWKEELERCSYDSILQSPSLVGSGKNGNISDKTASLAVKIAEIKNIIEAKLIELQLQRERIILYINSIDDSLIRQILFLRYISGFSWCRIATETGNFNSPDNLRIMHNNFLGKSHNKSKET